MQVLSIGEVLWDVFADRELLGGAPLNFSGNTARFRDSAALITAVGSDERGSRAGATPPWTLEECLQLASIPLEQVSGEPHHS